MRVWQPGSSLVSNRTNRVEDWSWAATRRRLTALYRLARPYRLRTALAIISLLAATASSLAPPILIGKAVDDVNDGHTGSLWPLVGLFVAASVVGTICAYAQTYFTGWSGERMLADLRHHVFGHLQLYPTGQRQHRVQLHRGG